MINDKGERVAGPKAPAIPPHMLNGMTSAGQKKVLGAWKRAESKSTRPSTAKRARTSATKSGATKRGAAKRGATTRGAKRANRAAPATAPATDTQE